MVTLGLGTISIGRVWGVTQTPVPSEEEAVSLLSTAYDLGISYFDTAPAYGLSEERLGTWLKKLSKADRSRITVATKFGEYWDFQKNEPYRDFGFLKIRESIERSFDLLGSIDIMQVHGFTKKVWDDNARDIIKGFVYAEQRGVRNVGMSLSNEDAAGVVLSNPDYSVIQFPHNIFHPYNKKIIQEAVRREKHIVINRPFAMGEIAELERKTAMSEAYRFIMKDIPNGVILTGTKSVKHLKENIHLFQKSQTSSL